MSASEYLRWDPKLRCYYTEARTLTEVEMRAHLTVVIHGAGRGADRSAGEIAHAHGLEDRRAELRAARHES